MSKSKFRPWALWRRIQYGAGFFLFLGMVGTFVYFNSYYQPPTCFDRIMNGDENGVDCSGSCVRVCPADGIPPEVVWVESFAVAPGRYNAVAYIDNNNQTLGLQSLPYTFQLFTGSELVAEQSGTTQLPPNVVYPVFAGRVEVSPDVEVTDTKFILGDISYWLPAAIERNQFQSVDVDLKQADTKPVLTVKLENKSLSDARDVEVVATIFNSDGDPVTASQTFADVIAARSTSDLVFTWPNRLTKTVKNCIIPTDVVLGIDLSGSMNNDSDQPPQPVTAALQAAQQFVDRLRNDDQVAVVTFATEADINSVLTNEHLDVSQLIGELTINPADEHGFTNTVAALTAAQTELISERHNSDARRVVVLLTDGLPTAPDDETDMVTEAVSVAESLTTAGVEVYAIGLGENVDQSFIQQIASSESTAYFAPTGADLATIYTEITSALCEGGYPKIDVIPKIKASFTLPK